MCVTFCKENLKELTLAEAPLHEDEIIDLIMLIDTTTVLDFCDINVYH